MRRKHIPERTCVGCRETQAKRELLRVVRTPEGAVEIDPTGKRSGRGAYVHNTRECWDKALKGKLEAALKTGLQPDNRQALEEHAQGLERLERVAPGGGESL